MGNGERCWLIQVGVYREGIACTRFRSSEGSKEVPLFGPSEEKIVGFMEKENPKDVSTKKIK